MSNNRQIVRNWSEYNLSLQKRGELILNFSNKFYKSLLYSGAQRQGGKKKYSDKMYKYLLKVKTMFRLSWRATVGFVKKLFLLVFGFPVAVPDYAHANRAIKQLKINIKTFKYSEDGFDIAFDSTGVNVYTTSGYHQRRYGKKCLYKQRDQWKKIHLCMELGNQQILSMAFTDSKTNDCEVINKLTNPLKFKINSVRADGAYDTGAIHKIIHEWGAKALIPPAITSKAQNELKHKPKKKEHLKQRDQIIKSIRRSKDFKVGLKRWKIRSGYHQRSKIESCMLRMKRIFGFNLQHKRENARINEIITKINILNEMSHLGMPKYAYRK
jgi:Transposase DDE domain